MDTLEYADIMCENKGHMVRKLLYTFEMTKFFFPPIVSHCIDSSHEMCVFDCSCTDIGPNQNDGPEYHFQEQQNGQSGSG